MASSIAVDGVGGIFLGGLVVWAIYLNRVYRRRARRVRETREGRSPGLEPGDTILHGRVELDRPGAAIALEIDQEGHEWESKYGPRHRWRVLAKRLTVHPFYVTTHGGERVRVEPGDRVRLVDRFVYRKTGPAQRTLTAELTPGETVHLVGRLDAGADPEAGYRDPGVTTILRPPRYGRMLVSTEPLEERHLAQARYHRAWAIILAVTFALFHGIVFRELHALCFTGEAVEATLGVADADGYTLDCDFQFADGTPAHRRLIVGKNLWRQVNRRQVKNATLVVSRVWPSVFAVGARPEAAGGTIPLLLFAVFLLGLVYWGMSGAAADSDDAPPGTSASPGHLWS